MLDLPELFPPPRREIPGVQIEGLIGELLEPVEGNAADHDVSQSNRGRGGSTRERLRWCITS
jgi:hypothetical protein